MKFNLRVFVQNFTQTIRIQLIAAEYLQPFNPSTQSSHCRIFKKFGILSNIFKGKHKKFYGYKILIL